MLAIFLLGGNLAPPHSLPPTPYGRRDNTAAPWPQTERGTGGRSEAGARRVNAPHDVPGEEAAIVWWGQVTPTTNYADARISYTDSRLSVRLGIIDRRLWYDTSPTLEELLNWDAASLYLDVDGSQGAAIDGSSYRFDCELVWWEARESYQAVYRGSGGSWAQATLPFTTTSTWNGDRPNNTVDDRGWVCRFDVPFASLGLGGPPPEGTVWGMAMVIHDRDDATGTPISDQVWPESTAALVPATWGQVRFGLPGYTPPPALPGGTITIREGHAGAVVPDGMVGGGTTCAEGIDFWTEWGEANYAGVYLNVQNIGAISEWPCTARSYLTFPLSQVPAGAAVISATLVLHQMGNAGHGVEPGPKPSLIQALTVADDWAEATLNWNNSPLAVENVAASWAYPQDPPADWPGVPVSWDVSRAVAEAHASGAPLRLALYESDYALHSGKYMISSEAGDWTAASRPTLIVRWGQPIPALSKSASPTGGEMGASIAYTIRILGTGQRLTLTDTLPAGLGEPFDIQIEGSGVTPSYDGAGHRLGWSDTPPAEQQVIIRYRATVQTAEHRALANVVELTEEGGEPVTARATVIANPYRLFLPAAGRCN